MDITKLLKNLTVNGIFVAPADKQKAILTTAKRLNIKVKTERLKDGSGVIVTRLPDVERSTSVQQSFNILDRIKELNATERLELFGHFEVCCGMDRGQCVCEPLAPVQSSTPNISKLDALRGLVDAVNEKHGPEDWRFTKDRPQYADNGNVYRSQVLWPDGKKRRTVQVDENDHELIIP